MKGLYPVPVTEYMYLVNCSTFAALFNEFAQEGQPCGYVVSALPQWGIILKMFSQPFAPRAELWHTPPTLP